MDKQPIPIKPLKDNLMLIPLAMDPPKESPGGIVMPKTKNPIQHPYRKGVVLSVGPGMNTEMDGGISQIPEHIKPGDIVLFHQAAGWDIIFEGDKYTMVSWRQIECMVDPEYVAWKKENPTAKE